MSGERRNGGGPASRPRFTSTLRDRFRMGLQRHGVCRSLPSMAQSPGPAAPGKGPPRAGAANGAHVSVQAPPACASWKGGGAIAPPEPPRHRTRRWVVIGLAAVAVIAVLAA